MSSSKEEADIFENDVSLMVTDETDYIQQQELELNSEEFSEEFNVERFLLEDDENLRLYEGKLDF